MNKTQITLHGPLGKTVGEKWNLAVKSVSEAIRAIEVLSQRKLYKFLYENDRVGLKYKILINGRQFEDTKSLDINNLETVKNSELCLNINNLRTIDIVPVLEGADSSTVAIVIGALLIVVGVVLLIIPGFNILGGALIIAGLGLVAAGVMNLLSSPPTFDDFREVQGGGSISYLFNGPQNTTREGGPVPLGYGRLIVGSQVISASYEISHKHAVDNPLTT